MTEIATSPPAQYHAHHRAPSSSARTSAPMKASTPTTNHKMPPYFSQHLPTPHTQQGQARAPSPNYFGLKGNGESNTGHTDASQYAAKNWSPPSSTVRSTAAASPSVVHLDGNTDYEAFRRQSEHHKAFSLGGLGGNFKMNAPPAKPTQARKGSRTSPIQSGAKAASEPRDMPPPVRPRDNSLLLDPTSAELSRSPKRMLSPGSASQMEPARKGSPAHFNNEDTAKAQARFNLPLDNADGPFGFPKVANVNRAETLPAKAANDGDANMFVTPQHVVNLIDSHNEGILILDLRVSTQYAASHVLGALNLCIPTTLLKRASFNVQKLAETFKDNEQRSRFEKWQNSKYIVVYDASSAQMKDAQICINTIKKFKSEGYDGTVYIVRGGFAEVKKSFPKYVEVGGDENGDGSQTLGNGGKEGPEIAPVIGGCPMPSTDKPANPFFGNIRQNMDLIGGVGQMPLNHPKKATKSAEEEFPTWLRRAAQRQDEGKTVSKKFEAIERREKKRMEDALSGTVSYGSGATPRPETKNDGVQIAGIEKGNKNRYNNIWPFEHSRVRLQGVPKSGCDYFNANFVQAALSNKRYISTQAPIPATFQDFWSVIWQQDVRVVVMLTAEKEGAQVKAHNYWEQRQFGPLHLDFLSEKRASLEPDRIHKHQQQKRPDYSKRSNTQSAHPQIPLATLDSSEASKAASTDQPYVIVRKFTLRHERHPFENMREITQLQYSSWPDFGAPAHPTHLLGLVEQTNAVVHVTGKPHSAAEPEPQGVRPILVHCSAGCGRTGTFCTVDSVIDMLKRQRLEQRGHSPMDIDSDAKPSRQHAKNDSKVEKPRDGDGCDFFASQYRHEDHEDQGVEGAWVQGQELDLVEKTVEDFRNQRLSMVQSLRQYVLCYEAVMEWLVDQRGS